jgi:alkylated DNA repair dioxygenase AlkB
VSPHSSLGVELAGIVVVVNLFEVEEERILPPDFSYRPEYLPWKDAAALFKSLRNSVEWEQKELVLYGKLIPIPRMTAWFGDPEADYTYSGIRNEAKPWTSELSLLRDRISESLGLEFNSALLNLYEGGHHSVSWHSDDEPELGPSPTIASISLGATRRFRIRHKKTRETRHIDAADGSLLVMSGSSQQEWEHCLPKVSRPIGERINITFRLFVRQGDT